MVALKFPWSEVCLVFFFYHPDDKAIELGGAGRLEWFTGGNLELYREMYKQIITKTVC